MNEVIDISRHESIFTPSNYPYPVNIIGAGAVGSRIFASLIELGITNTKVYDPDSIEGHNLANQIYTADDVGKDKVSGCANFVKRKLGITTENLPKEMEFRKCAVDSAYINRYDSLFSGIVFILTDTMNSRKEIFNALVQRCTTDPQKAPLLIIETRMGSTHGSIFTINPFDSQACKAWRSTLINDSDPDMIELSPCGTTLSVGTTASLIAGYAVWQMKQFFTDPIGMNPRLDLFFKPVLTITSSQIAT